MSNIQVLLDILYEGSSFQLLALRTDQVAFPVVEADLCHHAPLLVRIDWDVCRVTQVLQVLPQTPIVVVSAILCQVLRSDRQLL